MKFVDYVTITVRSGHGGSGTVSFRRERLAPRGGPNGGDGGSGGSVILNADSHLNTLLDLRYNRHHFAENGQRGSGSNKTGRDGKDIILRVPIGTVLKDTDSGDTIGEILTDDARLTVVEGGRGGKGNAFFKSSTRQAPKFSQDGETGEERNITLELKLLADVGLVGLPNVGKSTLVATLSAARPKIADYPFTTLAPSLGVVRVGDYQSFVIADIPGIIEGAHLGKGLGIQFLKHIERNAVLLLMIPVNSEDPAAEYATLIHELESFEPRMLEKPRMIAVTKLDLILAENQASEVETIQASIDENIDVFGISAVAQIGLEELRARLWTRVEDVRSFSG